MSYQSQRIRTGGLALPGKQVVFHPGGLKHEVSIVPSTSAPGFGTYFVLDYREKGLQIENASIQLNVSPLTGLVHADGGNKWQGAFVPSHCWFSRIEIVQNNNILDTIYGNQQFILQQLLNSDTERLTYNNLSGNYNSVRQRTLKASYTTDYHIHLHTLFDQANLSLLQVHDELQFRVYLADISTLIDYSDVMGGKSAIEGNPTAHINFCNLVVKHTKLQQSGLALAEIKDRVKNPMHALFHDTRYGLYNINYQPGSQQQIVMTSIVGNVALLFFVLRPVGRLSNENTLRFLDLAFWELVSSDGSNMMGGQVVNREQNQQLLAKWFLSSYPEETAYNSNSRGEIFDQAANVFCWSFSEDPVEALTHGKALTSKKFQGNEVIRITLPTQANSAYYDNIQIGSQIQCDVYALCESIHQSSATDIKKISL